MLTGESGQLVLGASIRNIFFHNPMVEVPSISEDIRMTVRRLIISELLGLRQDNADKTVLRREHCQAGAPALIQIDLIDTLTNLPINI